MSLYSDVLLAVAVITYRLLCVAAALAFTLVRERFAYSSTFNLKALRLFDLGVINWIVRYVKCAAWLPWLFNFIHVASRYEILLMAATD